MMNKKILMVGVLDVPSSTNLEMKKGFESLGLEVEAYNYRTRIRELGNDHFKMWDDFINFITGRHYALIVFCKVNQMHPECIKYAGRAGPTWYWFMDNLQTASIMSAEQYAEASNYASATASNVTEKFNEVNKNSYHMIEGYDPDVFYYEDIKKIYDITFVGNAYPDRIKDLNDLKSQGLNITIFGADWPGEFNAQPPVTMHEERRVINQSKLILNLCHDDTIFSNRVTKTLGCGAFVLSQQCKDLEIMKNTFYLDTYSSTEEALRKSEEAIEISDSTTIRRADFTNRFKDIYSWNTVCKNIMGIVG